MALMTLTILQMILKSSFLIRLENEIMSERQALERQHGKTVRLIQHHDVIGSVQIHFTDGSSIQIFAQEKANQQVTVFEPKN